MKKVKVIDLFNIKFEEMENKINEELNALQEGGAEVLDTRVLGDSLNKGAVFIVYQE